MFRCLSLTTLAVSLDWENVPACLFLSWEMHFIRLVIQSSNTAMWLNFSKDYCGFIHRPRSLTNTRRIRVNYTFLIFSEWRFNKKTSNWLKMKQPGNWFSTRLGSGCFVMTVHCSEWGMYTAKLTWGSLPTSSRQVKLSFISSCLSDTVVLVCMYWLWVQLVTLGNSLYITVHLWGL